MEKIYNKGRQIQFHGLKLAKKQQLTKNTFALEFDVPDSLRSAFHFIAGQYLPIQYNFQGESYINDYSLTSAPFEDKWTIAVKVNSDQSSVQELLETQIGAEVLVGEPQGRFTLESKPHEFRTILGFAAGIGITPILSHFKNILHNEPRTRLFLFYGNQTYDDIAFREEIDTLAKHFDSRFQVFYFISREETRDHLLFGRLDDKKLKLIINQILHLDDTDEESTIWDAVDEVLICGKGEMIKTLANACFENGIPKRNIHFELFEEFNDDIYPQEVDLPLITDIDVDFKILGTSYQTKLPTNKTRLLQQLLEQGFPVPYSCKSGICGTCECRLIEGDVELLENEYLTEREVEKGNILACMSVVLSKHIKINFDLVE